MLGSPDINGGTYVIYEHGAHLREMGHEVTMLTREQVTADRYQWHPRAKDLCWLTVDEAERVEFDLVFATYWQSPFLLPRIKARHYAYFVQSIESRFFEEPDPAHHNNRDLDIWKDYCESTYSLNVPVITEAKWIQDYLHEHYNRESFLVRNGIRKDIYSETGPAVADRTPGKLRVLVEGPVDVFYKNVSKSVELCLQAGVDEIWLLTSSDIIEFEGVDRVFSQVPIHDTPEIYRSCDVLVKLSYVEGMFGPPLEMFHCGGTSIVYEVTGHDEYIDHDQNSFVVAKDDDQQVVDYLQKLRSDQAELQRLKEGAIKTAVGWPDWQEVGTQFEMAVQKIVSGKPVSPEYLQKWANDQNEKKKRDWHLREIDRFAERERATGISEYEPHNFVQIYHKAEGAQIDPEKALWFHYKCDEQTRIATKIAITGLPFWIRIDPSVRIGVVNIDSIMVVHCDTEAVVLDLKDPEDFDDLYLDGTIKRVGCRERNLFISYGIDPWFYLPQITTGQIGDEIEVIIQLREIGMTQFANRYSVNHTKDPISASEGIVAKLLRRVAK